MKHPFHRILAAGISALALSAGLTGAAQADQVIDDDLIVRSSICVGMDCVNGETFGFDTLRLKENNLRIRAMDTSNSASFPTRDWQITFNDSTNGGQDKFSIDDLDGGRTPFTIEASAPNHSLYVDDGGRIGLGTSTPVVEMHVIDGDSPTLRLEQDGSSGFTPQTWDLASNETNFFLRDATNGSRLPFRVRPSAPTNSIYVDTDGDIGFGTASPDAGLHIASGSLLVEQGDTGAGAATLHVRRSDGTAKMRIEETSTTLTTRNMLQLINNGGSSITMENTGSAQKWRIFHAANGDFLLSSNANANDEMTLDDSGNLTILGTLTTAGSCSVGCDRVFEEGYEILPIDTRAEMMWDNGYLPNVGPTAEDGPFNISDKMGRMLNELEHAHIYIAQLNERLKALEETASLQR